MHRYSMYTCRNVSFTEVCFSSQHNKELFKLYLCKKRKKEIVLKSEHSNVRAAAPYVMSQKAAELCFSALSEKDSFYFKS